MTTFVIQNVKMKKSEIVEIEVSPPKVTIPPVVSSLNMSVDQGLIFKADWNVFIKEHFKRI